MIVDLETFDNGDMNVVGDGADIQVIDPRDNSLVQLRGFSVSPGTSVNVKIRPNLFSITEGALGFNYIDRKCIEPSVDKELNYVDEKNGRKYSLSNCLVAATLDEIFNKCPGMENMTRSGQLYEGRTLQCLNHHMSQVRS